MAIPKGKKTTDWKAELEDLGEGRVILKAGTRSSIPGTNEAFTRGRMLGLLEENRRRRGKKSPVSKTIEERLKGLFGGGK